MGIASLHRETMGLKKRIASWGSKIWTLFLRVWRDWYNDVGHNIKNSLVFSGFARFLALMSAVSPLLNANRSLRLKYRGLFVERFATLEILRFNTTCIPFLMFVVNGFPVPSFTFDTMRYPMRFWAWGIERNLQYSSGNENLWSLPMQIEEYCEVGTRRFYCSVLKGTSFCSVLNVISNSDESNCRKFFSWETPYLKQRDVDHLHPFFATRPKQIERYWNKKRTWRRFRTNILKLGCQQEDKASRACNLHPKSAYNSRRIFLVSFVDLWTSEGLGRTMRDT